MTDRTPQVISCREAAELLKVGAVLVDIREAAERSEVIEGALHAPMSEMDAAALPNTGKPVIFHCRSGRRTAMNADVLQSKVGECAVYIVEGGMEGWAAEGLPVKPVS